MPKMPIGSKKGVPRYALVAFKDLLESHVYVTKDLSGPKSMGTGATVKVTINGDIFKGTIVSIADNENYLKKQNQSFNVNGFFGFPKSKKSLMREKHLPEKVSIPPTNDKSQQLTSTPVSSKYRRLSVKHLPSPIQLSGSLESRSTTFTSKTFSAPPVQDDSVDDVDDIIISLVEASYDSSSYAKLNHESIKNQFIKDVPDCKVDLSMNFSSFSSTFDYLQNRIQPLIGVTTNMLSYQPPEEITSSDTNVAQQLVAGHLGPPSSVMDTAEASTKDVSKSRRRSRIPVLTTKPNEIPDRDYNTVSTESHTTRTVDTDVYLDTFFPPTSHCSLPAVQDDIRPDFNESFNVGGRMEETVILDSLSEDDPCQSLNESEFPPTKDDKSLIPHTPLTPEEIGYAVYNARMYNLDSEGDVHMMTIPASTMMESSQLQDHSCMNSSNKENISPRTQDDAPFKYDYDRFLQITPTELFYGLMLRSEYPPRMDDVSLFTETILLHLKSVSSRPEVFARNLLYRMFTLADLRNSSVYGRGITKGIRNIALNVDKVRLIRELTFALYSDVRFSWRNCVLWMDKSIKYVNKLL